MMIRLIRVIKRINVKLFSLLMRNSFGSYGSSVRIQLPLHIDGANKIHIGNRVKIGYNAWLAAVSVNEFQSAFLSIGDDTYIGNFSHIFSTMEIVIENKVLIADKVYISDNLHTYDNIHVPIIDQPIKQCQPVRICSGSWIGENVCIIGASIGKNCVVGANSVVTKDIPDYCVAVGAPAKVIKKFNFELNIWENIYN